MIEVNLKELKENYVNLSEDTMSAIKELESLTGKWVMFRLINSSETQGCFKLKVKLARNFMDKHIVIINTDMVKNNDHLDYLIVHEMMHGFRMFNAEASERRVLATNEEKERTLKKVIRETITPISPLKMMPQAQVDDVLTRLILDNNTVLFNSSVDARIELAIYDKYPNLRKAQKSFQKEYVKEIVGGFNKEIDKMLPTWITKRARLMNYCYLLKITPIIGKSWTSKVNANIDADFLNTVKEMMVYLDKEDMGQVSDNETIEAWAKILEMDKYVHTTDFENVSFMYQFMN